MRLSETKFLIIDLETTGLDHTKDKVVEVAAMFFNINGNERLSYKKMCNPGIPIPPSASAVHHITDEMVQDEKPFEDGCPWLFNPEYFSGEAPSTTSFPDFNCLVGHNIVGFDNKFLPEHNYPVLDTMLLAKKVWPDMESYSNQYLRYYHKLYLIDGVGRSAHEALSDVRVTSEILKKLIHDVKSMKISKGEDTQGIMLSDIIAWSLVPNLLKVCRFGKHKDRLWSEIPKDYLQWMDKNMKDMDADTKFTVQHYL